MAQARMQSPPLAPTRLRYFNEVKVVCFLHWHLIKCPFRVHAADVEQTRNKSLPAAVENWEQASCSPFQSLNNTTAETENPVSFKIL